MTPRSNPSSLHAGKNLPFEFLSPSAGCWLSICSAAAAKAAAEKCDSNSARKRMKHPLWNFHSSSARSKEQAYAKHPKNTATRNSKTHETLFIVSECNDRSMIRPCTGCENFPPNFELPRSPKPAPATKRCASRSFSFSVSLPCRSHRKFLNQSFPWFWSHLMTHRVSHR